VFESHDFMILRVLDSIRNIQTMIYLSDCLFAAFNFEKLNQIIF